MTAMDRVMIGDMFLTAMRLLASRPCSFVLRRQRVAFGVVPLDFIGRFATLLNRPIESYAAITESDDARRVLRDIRLVCDEHDS